MPRNLFQEIVFTLIMVVVMVYGMVCYNIALDMDGLTNVAFLYAISELPIMGVVAFLLELLLVGHIVKMLAFKIVTPQDRPIVITLTISIFTILFMCPIMSFFATVFFKGGLLQENFIALWIQTTAQNLPMALIWQLCFAGPLVRFIFRNIFRSALAE